MSDTQHEVALLLQKDWDIALPDTISESAILELLALRVAQLLERSPEYFFQLMYRLDISEKKLNAVMHHLDAPHHIARLIYDRQLQKIKSREYFRDHPLNDDDGELKWV